MSNDQMGTAENPCLAAPGRNGLSYRSLRLVLLAIPLLCGCRGVLTESNQAACERFGEYFLDCFIEIGIPITEEERSEFLAELHESCQLIPDPPVCEGFPAFVNCITRLPCEELFSLESPEACMEFADVLESCEVTPPAP